MICHEKKDERDHGGISRPEIVLGKDPPRRDITQPEKFEKDFLPPPKAGSAAK
jgi:hypothetical protein